MNGTVMEAEKKRRKRLSFSLSVTRNAFALCFREHSHLGLATPTRSSIGKARFVLRGREKEREERCSPLLSFEGGGGNSESTLFKIRLTMNLASLPRAAGALSPFQTRISLQAKSLCHLRHLDRIATHKTSFTSEAAERRKSSSMASSSSAIASSESSPPPLQPPPPLLVKVCGVTSPDDAAVAAAAGADLIGVIMWPKAKRAVTAAQAKAIGEAARREAAAKVVGSGSEKNPLRRGRRLPSLVGVFVDEGAETIARVAAEADLDYVQLHGDGAREALPELLGMKEDEKGGSVPFGIIFVLTVGSDGVPKSKTPSQICAESKTRIPKDPRPDLLLVDGPAPGSGEAWDWRGLSTRETSLAAQASEETWLLAGGLHPGNVAAAVEALAPGGVDVSSGVCGEDGLRKDEGRVAAFVAAARGGGSG